MKEKKFSLLHKFRINDSLSSSFTHGAMNRGRLEGKKFARK
jgi:hypothetical protein